MASFEQHVNTAVIITGISIAPLYSSSLVDLNQALTLLFFGMIGGVLPDMDLENSKPLQITSSILSLFVPLLAILILLESLSIIKMLVMWFLFAGILHFMIFKVLLNLTVHRGIIHSIPMGIFLSQILAISFFHLFHYPELFSILCGIFLFLGFIIHLLLDEFISLNVFGSKFKKSLGSAFKLYQKDNLLGSLFLYVAIIALYISYPFNLKYFFDIYQSLQNITL